MRLFKRKKPQDQDPGKTEERVPLEKGDIPALFIAAVLTLGPYFLLMIGVMVFLGWVFGAFR